MPLFRNEFNKTIIRLRLLRDEMLEKNFPNTARVLSETICMLEKADNIYIQELADKKRSNTIKTK